MKERWCFDRQGGWKRGIANTPGMRTHPACAKASGPRAATSATATRRKSILMLDKKPIRSRSVLRMMRDWSGRGCVQCAAYDARLEGLVIVLECDGVLVDIHNNGHRRAFNMAFEVCKWVCATKCRICMHITYIYDMVHIFQDIFQVASIDIMYAYRRWDTAVANGPHLCTLTCFDLETPQDLA